MARKKRKTRQERGVDPEQEIIEEGSKEAIEAAEVLDKEQQAHMADLDDDNLEQPEPEAEEADPAEEEKPSEKPAEAEPKSPPEEAKEPEAEKEAKAEEQPPGEAPEAEAKVPDDSKPEEKPTEEAPKEPTFVSGDQLVDYSVEVVSDEGAKSVPLGNLVTTYQQFGHLQRKYQEVKPVFDLLEDANKTLPPEAHFDMQSVIPVIEVGVQAIMKQQGIVHGTQPPVAAAKPVAPAGVGGYQGPFEDAEQDAYYKEVDPDHYSAMHNMFNMIQGGGKVAQLEQEIENLKRSRTATPADPAATNQAQEDAQKAFDEKILAWSGDHTDYFSAENIGEARLNAFKNFIIRNHAKGGLKINDLNPEFLAAEFARFDPRYNLEYMKRLATQKVAEAKEESGMFAEGSGTRTQAEPLDEQQKHMADI